MASSVHGFVYLIRNTTNGKVYVGQTVQTLDRRWYEHRLDSRSGTKHLYRAMQKYGLASFTFTELGRAYCQRELDDMETRSIRSHEATNQEFGYNLRPGGSGGPMSEEHKRKIGAANAISLRGKKQAAELVAKRVAPLIGRKQSAELIEMRIAPQRGRKCSPEHIEKNRQKSLGKVIGPEQRAKIRASMIATLARKRAEREPNAS